MNDTQRVGMDWMTDMNMNMNMRQTDRQGDIQQIYSNIKYDNHHKSPS